MGSLLDNTLAWFHDDITWCGNECNYTECERNQANMWQKEGFFSCAMFKDTELCALKEKDDDQIF